MAGREREVSFKIRAQDEYSAQLKAARDAVNKLREAQSSNLANAKSSILLRQIKEVSVAYTKAANDASKLGRAAQIKLDSSAPTEAAEMQRAFEFARARAEAYREEITRLNGALRGVRGAGGGNFAIFSQSASEMQAQAAAAKASVAALRERAALATRGAQQIGPSNDVPLTESNRRLASMRETRQSAIDLAQAYDTQRQQVALLGKAVAQAETPTEQMVAEFERAKTALAAVRAEMQRTQAQSAKMAGGFSTFARRTATPQAAAPAQGWWSRMSAGIVGSASTAHGRGPLGLRPYELQNLGYQVNDLVTQVASGTPVMQAFAQQGGQIAQIFPKATTAIVRFTPQIAAISAVVLPVIAAISRLNETGDILTDFGTKLAATVDGSQYDPAELTAMVRELERVGIAADASRGAIVKMVQDGLDPQRMQAILVASRDFASVWGMEIPDAASALQNAFDGTYDSLKELDDQYNFLTAAQRTQLRELYEQGRGFEATTQALEIFSDKMGEAADLQEGPWSEASQNLANAWRDLLDWIGTTAPIQAAIGAVNVLASVVASLTEQLNGLDAQATGVAGKIDALGRSFLKNGFGGWLLNGIKWLNDDEPPAPPAPENTDFIGPRQPTEQQKKAAEDAELVRREATLKAMGETAKVLDKANAAMAEERTKAAEKQAKAEADARAKVDSQIAETMFGETLAGLSKRDQAIMQAVHKAEQDMAAAGLSLDDERRQSIIQTTGALYDQEEAARKAAAAAKKGGKDAKDAEKEKQRALEDTLNKLLEQRQLLMDSVDYYRENGDQSAADRLAQQVDGVNERILVAIGNLRAFWTAAGGLEGETELLRLDDLQRGIQAVGEGATFTKDRIDTMIADGAVDAMDQFAESVARGENLIDSFGRAFMSMAADFLREIAAMIVKQAVLNALQGATGGVGGFIASTLGAVVAHSGTEASGTRTRVLPAAMFANAPRYHNGTSSVGAALASDEQAAVLRKGEAVLTEDDPYHPKNRGKLAAGQGGGTTLNAKIVNVLDPAEVMQRAIADEAGQEVLINWMTANQRRINSVLGR